MEKIKSTAVNRRKDIVSAAIEVFAESGYYRATTAQVAERAAISQPYVFRFFATKEELLIEALKVSFERIVDSFRRVVSTASPDGLERGLIDAYTDIMQAYRNEILLQMQAYTVREEAVMAVVQEGLRDIRHTVHEAFLRAGIGQPAEKTMLFLARGMLCHVAMATNSPELMNITD